MMDIQTEHAYQKQLTVFQNKKRVLLGETGKEKFPKYYKHIGLGFRAHKEATESTYFEKKCPYTGHVSIRRWILSDVVTKMKMQTTTVTHRDHISPISEGTTDSRKAARTCEPLSPDFWDVRISDTVTVGECRPLSDTVCFYTLKVTKATDTGKQFQKL
ncbi:40S ribosomal protein S11-like [Zalophus californianus]|uniref:Small ribosomal subunit protein uS17 n=1 Tax=Zalophus californianus TaxID=9704 RepID=A0A6J2E6Z0_ZALCA|nr:40S ribosomal protein S11-like [Zalophus californianus]XP_027958590.1 40S ribosomal protein S11-like [Eumetopias jubatus]